ncbi:MAG: hypothetical protein A3I66_22345 [Burkholderiales bacterium RIFCSPLOWO2_02_FULL_57_36]|nr:MAG: hypothetical protein A3I66_22345 [Burkholderiales bacterium RIFCSPLOWO2_02_FULL_57_36]
MECVNQLKPVVIFVGDRASARSRYVMSTHIASEKHTTVAQVPIKGGIGVSSHPGSAPREYKRPPVMMDLPSKKWNAGSTAGDIDRNSPCKRNGSTIPVSAYGSGRDRANLVRLTTAFEKIGSLRPEQ